jgi:transposase
MIPEKVHTFTVEGWRSSERDCYLRHRAKLIQHRAPHILHIQKALQQMNLQVHHVLSDVTGATGKAILSAIVAGERDALGLAQWRDPQCKASEATFVKALTGDWREEHLFALKQSLELYDFYTAQVAACDAQIKQHFSTMKPHWDSPAPQPPANLPVKGLCWPNSSSVDNRGVHPHFV